MKTTKYTEEDTAILTKMYKDGHSMEDIALALDRTVRSVTAKLTSIGLYQKAPYRSKDGSMPVKKETYVTLIANKLGVHEELVGSLEKCTKFTLKKLYDALTLGAESRP